MNKLIRLIRKVVHDLVLLITPKWARKHMLSCKEVLSLLNDQDQDHSFSKYMKLRMHLLICQCCTDYTDQMNIIEKQSQNLGKLQLTEDQINQINSSKTKVLSQLKK